MHKAIRAESQAQGHRGSEKELHIGGVVYSPPPKYTTLFVRKGGLNP